MNSRILHPAKAPSRSPPIPAQERTSSLRTVKTPEPTAIPDALQIALESPGHPLEITTRTKMESRFGHDFSQVRVHTDAKAATSAQSLEAIAFTINQDIFFAAGHYQPHTPQGQWLLAHELTHTLQQRQPLAASRAHPLPFRFQPSPYTLSSDSLEQEAAVAASCVTTEQPIPPGLISVAAPHAQGIIARQPAMVSAASKTPQALDPARLTEFLLEVILKNLQADPEDRSGRIRRQIAQMTETTRQTVLDRLRDRLPQSQWQQLNNILAQSAPAGDESLAAEPTTAEPTTEPTTAETTADQPSPESAALTPETEPAPEALNPEPEPLSQDATVQPQPQPITDKETSLETEGETPKKTENSELQTQSEAQAATTSGEAITATAETAATTATAATAPAGAVLAGGAESEAIADLAPLDELEAKVVRAQPKTPAVAQASALEPTASEPTAPEPTLPESTSRESEPASTAPGEPVSTPDETAAETKTVPAEAKAESPLPETPAAEPAIAESSAVPEPSPAAESIPDSAAPETPSAESEPSESAEAMAPAIETSEETPPEPVEAAPPAPSDAGTEGTSATAPPALEAAPTVGSAPEPLVSDPVPTIATGPETALEPDDEQTRPTDNPATTPSAIAPVSEPEGTAIVPAALPVSESPAPPATISEAAPEGLSTTPVEGAAEVSPEGATEATPAGTTETAPGGKPGCPPGLGAEEAKGEGAEAGGEGGGGGGGGGGAALTEQPPPTVPDVSQSDPVQAIATVGSLPPAQLQTALGGVSAAAAHSVNAQRSELVANPPQMERPSGSPPGKEGGGSPIAQTASTTVNAPKSLERIPPGQASPIPTPEPLPTAPVSPAQTLALPRVTGNAQGQLSESDAQQIQASIRNLPTTDPGLVMTAGVPPTLKLEGEADPTLVQNQQAKLDQSVQKQQTQGKQDVAQPMGEQQIYPHVPQETLKATVVDPSQPASGAGQAIAGGGEDADDPTLSIVAQEKKGDEIKAAVIKAQGDMVTEQQNHATQVEQTKADSQKEMDNVVQDSATIQEKQRTDAIAGVQTLRQDWTQEQNEKVSTAQKDADAKVKPVQQEITAKQTGANQEAVKHIEMGNKDADKTRQDAEKKALGERQKAESKSGGVLGWLADKVTSFFNSIKQAIRDVFDAARKLVREAIEKAKKLAVEAIEQARKAIVNAIHQVGDALIAIGDTLLAAFPELRDRFRKAIKDKVKETEDAVNKFANQLKEDVQKALDFLGKALDAVLGLLEKGLLMAVDAVNSVVQGAIQFARSVVQAFAAFAALIKDIAANPGQWLKNLGASAIDGVRNHLWKALKKAMKEWFNSKLEEVLGLGKLLQILIRGCISFAQVGQMAWRAILSALPIMLIQLLIEKLIALLIPAAEAVMLIIQGVQAAWGSISRIIQAFETFFTFLKAVKGGNAGPQFANALAAGAVALIEFIANFLLVRLGKALTKVGQKLRGIAQGLQKVAGAVRRGAGAVVRGVKTVGSAVVRGVKAAGRAVVSGGKTVVRTVVQVGKQAGRAVVKGVKRVGKAIARTRVGRLIIRGAQTVGRGLKRGYQAVKQTIQRGKERIRQWLDKKRRERTPDVRLSRAQAILSAMLTSGVAPWTLPLRLAALKLWYGLSSSEVTDAGENITVTLRINPTRKVGAQTRTKKLHRGSAKVISFGNNQKLTPASLIVIAQAVLSFKRAVRYYSDQGVTDPSELGRRAGAAAEKSLLKWSQSIQGVSGVRVGQEFPSVGGVPLGGRRWYGKKSSDAKYARGRIILDFKLSPKAQRLEQHRSFVRFAINNGYTIVYIYGR